MPPNAEVFAVPMVVDLFERSIPPANAVLAYKLSGYLKLQEFADVFGISKRGAHLAAQLGKAMHEAGLTDPYIRLTERPSKVARWRGRGWTPPASE